MQRLTLLFGALCLACASTVAGAAGTHRVTYSTNNDFDTTKTLLVEALTSRGLVVSSTSHVGEMLERTGRDLGAARQIFLKAEALEFCSATLSRKMMEADPHNIVFCPYIIAIYVVPKEPNKTYLSFRRHEPVGNRASRESLRELDKLLRTLIEEAIQ